MNPFEKIKRGWVHGVLALFSALFAMALVALAGGDSVDMLMAGLIIYHVKLGQYESAP